MKWDDFKKLGIENAIVLAFSSPNAARALLLSSDFPEGRIPLHFDDAEQFWAQVFNLLRAGIIEDPVSLVQKAAENFPGNLEFKAAMAHAEQAQRQQGKEPEIASSPRVSPEDEVGGFSVLITGGADVRTVLDRSREIAAARGIDSPIDFGVVNGELAQLRLRHATSEQALELAQVLEGEGLTDRVDVMPNEFRDYLFQRIFVEGPDQGRYELNDVPASTRIKDIAQAITNDYTRSWPLGRDGEARRAVMDKIDETTGVRERLEADATLHQSSVEDGDTLHMAPEATAGGLNANLKIEALARARSQVMAFAEDQIHFKVRANAKNAPTEYLLNFTAPGWGPPSGTGGEPYPVTDHEVLLLLPSDFPMLAPGAFWQTPVFHPNIARKNGKVCLGVLEDRYRPGLDFAELCQMLVDIAGYRNYEVEEGYDEEARNWALSSAGQIAIEQRGGWSITRLILRQLEGQLRVPLPLRVKRLER